MYAPLKAGNDGIEWDENHERSSVVRVAARVAALFPGVALWGAC